MATQRLPLRLLARKSVRLGGRTYGSGSPIQWRNLGLTERKAYQLVRLGYFQDPFKRDLVVREGEAELLELTMPQLRELLPEGVKARDKKKAVELILAAREELEPEPEE